MCFNTSINLYSKVEQFKSIYKLFLFFLKIENAEKMKLVSQNVRSVPRFPDQIHCLIYVIKATSNPYPQDPKAPLNMIKEIRNNRRGIFQYVFITTCSYICTFSFSEIRISLFLVLIQSLIKYQEVHIHDCGKVS